MSNKFAKTFNPVDEEKYIMEYTMKIGKHKGKTLAELVETDNGQQYLLWFANNIVNDTNRMFYGKILKVVDKLKKEKVLKVE